MEIAPTAPDRFTACRGSFMPRCPPDRQKRPQEPPQAVGVQEYHPHRKAAQRGAQGAQRAGQPRTAETYFTAGGVRIYPDMVKATI